MKTVQDLRSGSLKTRMASALVLTVLVVTVVAVLALCVTRGWGPILAIDTAVANHAHAWALDNPRSVAMFRVISDVLAPWVLRGVAIGLVVVFAVRRRTRLAFWIAVSAVGGTLLSVAIKIVVGRSRPSFSDPVATAGGYSFPSGHALNSFVILGVGLAVLTPMIPSSLRVVLRIGVCVAIVLVGASRIVLGVHYLSDVIAAWIVGAGVIAVTALVFAPQTTRPVPAQPSGAE